MHVAATTSFVRSTRNIIDTKSNYNFSNINNFFLSVYHLIKLVSENWPVSRGNISLLGIYAYILCIKSSKIFAIKHQNNKKVQR